MKHVKIWWILLFLVNVFPYIPLIAAGFLWLYDRRLLWMWLALTGTVTAVGWGLGYWFRRRELASSGGKTKAGRRIRGDVEADSRWSAAGQTAWQQVEVIARRVQDQDLPLDRPDPMWEVFREVLETVARNFRPDAKEPSLEIPLPQALQTVELVARDLRDALAANVPGSHILTLGDLKRLQKLVEWGQKWYYAYRLFVRIGRFSVNPVSAVVSEIRDAAAGNLWDTSTTEMKRWAVGFAVRKAGYYSIQMYSGQSVGDGVLSGYQTQQLIEDASLAESGQSLRTEEPLRILVLGQVKAGKSSLINALFGEVRTEVDAVPRTKNARPYVLEREGIPLRHHLGYARIRRSTRRESVRCEREPSGSERPGPGGLLGAFRQPSSRS